MRAMNLRTVSDALAQLQKRTVSAREIMDACTAQVQRLNPSLNAFITLAPSGQETGEGSASRGLPRRQDSRRSLEGIPVAIKDLFETANLRTTAGTLFWKDYLPAEDAIAVRRLKLEGALIVGKTNTHEIALGVTTQNPHFGACRNPWDATRIPGGSSGGSAVAVATGMALAALGTDTGGSIRIPASLCGVVGLKPTYGRVSVRGVIPLSWNLDHVGPLTSTVEDAAVMLGVLAGFDAADPFCVDRKVEDYASGLAGGIKGWRLGLGVGEYVNGASADITEAVSEAAKTLEAEGAAVIEVDVSFLREAALANGIMTQADAAAYHRERLADHPEWFGEDVRTRLEAGRRTSATEYSLARRTQSEMKRRLEDFFKTCDVLLLPTTPTVAPAIEGTGAVEEARRLTRFTAPFNLTGVPAISMPCGLNGEGLPMGLQMVGRPWEEARLLRAAFSYQKATGGAPPRPPIARNNA